MSRDDVPGTVARAMPPTKPPANPLEAEIAEGLVAIEANYHREGTGHGSRFQGERIEVVQARWAISRVREADPAPIAPWLAALVRNAALMAEETACNEDHDGNDGCDGCAWDQLYAAVPHPVKAAAERAAIRNEVQG